MHKKWRSFALILRKNVQIWRNSRAFLFSNKFAIFICFFPATLRRFLVSKVEGCLVQVPVRNWRQICCFLVHIHIRGLVVTLGRQVLMLASLKLLEGARMGWQRKICSSWKRIWRLFLRSLLNMIWRRLENRFVLYLLKSKNLIGTVFCIHNLHITTLFHLNCLVNSWKNYKRSTYVWKVILLI